MSVARRIVVAVVAVGVLLGGGVLASRIPVGDPHAVSKPYAAVWVLRSTALQRCATFTARGTVTATWRATLAGGAEWSRIRVQNPVVVAASGCAGSPAWRMGVHLAQGWSEAGCALRAEPVAQASEDDAGPSSLCPADRVASFSTEEGPSSAPLVQANGGNPAEFADAVLLPWQSLVLRGRIAVRAVRDGSEDATGRVVDVALGR